MEFSGLQIINEGDDNEIYIHQDAKFNLSRIHVRGNGNKIYLGKTKIYNQLFINFKGDKKEFSISKSEKNINNLKFTSIRGTGQKLIIGKNFSCGGIEIQMNDGNEKCEIGDGCLFSWGIKMRTSDGHSVISLNTKLPINYPRNISIGNHVWIGEDVKILKGGVIPSNCVVGGFSVVTKPFDVENCIIAGFPAKVVKKEITWDRRMPYEFD